MSGKVFAVVVLVTLVQVASSLTCYSCNNCSVPSMDDETDCSGIVTDPVCATTVENSKVVSRACRENTICFSLQETSEVCNVAANVTSNCQVCCNSDRCNNASYIEPVDCSDGKDPRCGACSQGATHWLFLLSASILVYGFLVREV